MLKYFLFIIGFSSLIYSQESEVIEVSKNYKTILIFPSGIIESIIGENVVFIQEQSKSENTFSKRVLKLSINKAAQSRNTETNINIITEDGLNYLYTLKQTKERPKKLTYNIKSKNALFDLNVDDFSKEKNEYVKIDSLNYTESNEHKYGLDSNEYSGEFSISKTTRSDSLYIANPDEYYRKQCFYNQNKKRHIPRYFTKNGNVYLWLRNVYINKDDLYFQFKIENKNTVDFDIELIKYFISTKYENAGSNQETEIKPVYKYLEPSKVKGLKDNSFILVFKKFSLEKKMVFKVSLKESNGARILELDVERNLVNNPIIF